MRNVADSKVCKIVFGKLVWPREKMELQQ